MTYDWDIYKNCILNYNWIIKTVTKYAAKAYLVANEIVIGN